MATRNKPVDMLLSSEVGRRELLLGNEAIVRGAIEAGVGLVSGYPGTPASEVGDTFHRLQRELGISFEYSVNEKIALELAFGACLTGTRALVSMKHLGLSSAADPLSTMPYIGAVGGLVIVSAADPGCLTSPNEQDQRYFGRMFGLPTLDPATPDEARRMTAFAFELSEACQLPVLLRITTRVCHTRAAVSFGALPGLRPKGVFRRDPSRFIPTPVNARRMREVLQRRLDRACELLTASQFNLVSHPAARSGTGTAARKGLIAAGAARNTARELVSRSELAAPLLELGALHPLPHEVIVPFLSQLDDVLVLEELTPYLEDSLLAIAHHHGLGCRVHGKRDGLMPWPFELEPEEVEARVRDFLGVARPAAVRPASEAPAAPPRPPVLCAGCPHRNTFHAVTAVFGDQTVYVSDIGCYTLGANPPHHAGDVLLAMGSSLPMAAGISRTTGERVVAFIGDSSFFHSGMPALLDAVQNDDDVVLVVMDNDITAMTGFQPSPGTPEAGEPGTKRHIADFARALGVKDVAVVDPADIPATLRAFERAKKSRHLSMVVAEGPCAMLMHSPQQGAAKVEPPKVDHDKCHTCGMSEAGLYCELAPSLAVQRRMAAQRVDGPAPLALVTGSSPSRGMPAAREKVPETSPCSVECPIGICIPAYVGAIAAGEPERALQTVALRAALPSVCSHICHRPCEAACIHVESGGRPIAVNELKRYLTERHPAAAIAPREPPKGPTVAVVGAGPAGLAAARELVRRGYAPTLFDARPRPGGMLEYAIPEHRLPRSVLRGDIAAVLAEGVRFEGGARLGDGLSLAQLKDRGFGAVLLALGAQRATRPPIPGADSKHVTDALAFLAEPTSLSGHQVVVVGGGDVAVDAARVALRQGAASACLVFPEPEGHMAAARDSVQAARDDGVTLFPGHVVVQVNAQSVATGVVVGFKRGAEGKVSWDAVEAADELLATSVIFATGQRPALEGLDLPAGLAQPSGRLGADDFGRTAAPWLFACGDVATGPTNVTAAMASGARAAYAIDEFFLGHAPEKKPAAPPPRKHGAGAAMPHARSESAGAYSDADSGRAQSAGAESGRVRPVRGELGGAYPVHPERRPQAEVEGRIIHRPLSNSAAPALTHAEALAEAQRCFLCGMCRNCNTCVELLGCPAISRDGRDSRPHILDEACNVCGACVQACPNGAIG
jgi:indolepyruvate ferredoxin oxidoreductase alpha subunit